MLYREKTKEKKKKSMINKKDQWMLLLFSLILLITPSSLHAQTTRRVLFLGNSYTGVNNLPQIVYDIALSVGDTLVFDSYTPGGYQLMEHYTDNMSLNKIMAGEWEYVVLQGQSQEPITHNSQFVDGGFQLNNFITQFNHCSVTMLYMTWGYKNGDAFNCSSFPVMCTYVGMDSTIRNNYLHLASVINAEVSPVSVVWKWLRQNHPGIELYQADGSHPTAAGSFAAACCFYAMLFKKDPSLIPFNYGLSTNNASIIKDAVRNIVFDNLDLWDYKQPPLSDFQYHIGAGSNEVFFNPLTQGTAETVLWDFGDFTTSSLPNPVHSYLSNGSYTVKFTATNCDLEGLHTSMKDTVIQFCNHTPTVYTSHPWLCRKDTLWTQPGDSYRWFSYGMPVAENNQYLADYIQYDNSSFSVLTTINGCAELSRVFAGTPEWSGYFFDILPGADPCTGDTVSFAVLHTGGSLSGSENILWYRNGTLLTQMTNEDTLFISAPGTYECRVTNPASHCPSDTTSFLIDYDCVIVGITETGQDPYWNIFPNPASEIITIKLANNIAREQVEIYSATGLLIKVLNVSGTTSIDISDFPGGLYFVRFKNKKLPALKFIKHQ